MSKHNLKIAKRYARALFDLVSPTELEGYEQALKSFESLYESQELLRTTLKNPAYPLEQRVQAARGVAGLVMPDNVIFANFVSILVDNKRIYIIGDITKIFSEMLAQRKRMLTLRITSAFPLPGAEQAALLQRIQKDHGGLAAIEWEVDPDILGGLLIRSGDKLYDSSLRGSLEKVREELTV